jgi:hypothetical protein
VESLPGVKEPTVDKKTIRDRLKDKRNLLFERYSKNPTNTRLAIEIKLVDDQIADLTAQLAQQTKADPD